MIKTNDIRVFITPIGHVIGEFVEDLEGGRVKISNPLKMAMESNETIAYKPMIIKEEWAIMPSSAVQVECAEAFTGGYKEACSSVFSNLVMPSMGQQSAILNRKY